MPTYATVPQVLSAFPFVGSATNISSAVIAQFITDAEAIINANVAKRYDLPFSVAVPLLTRLAIEKTVCDLARKRIQFHFTAEMMEKSNAGLMCEEVNKTLVDIAEGYLPLVDSSGEVISQLTSQLQVYSSTEGYKPTMREDDWHDHGQDENKLDDIRSDRDSAD